MLRVDGDVVDTATGEVKPPDQGEAGNPDAGPVLLRPLVQAPSSTPLATVSIP